MLGCGKFLSIGGEFVVQQVVEMLWARPLVVLYNISVAGIRVVEFGTKYAQLWSAQILRTYVYPLSRRYFLCPHCDEKTSCFFFYLDILYNGRWKKLPAPSDWWRSFMTVMPILIASQPSTPHLHAALVVRWRLMITREYSVECIPPPKRGVYSRFPDCNFPGWFFPGRDVSRKDVSRVIIFPERRLPDVWW